MSEPVHRTPSPGALWEQAFEAMRSPVLILGASRHIQDCNQAFADMWQTSREELRGRSWDPMAEGRWETSPPLPEEKSDSEPPVEPPRLRKGGRTLVVYGLTLRDDQGVLQGEVLFFQDITIWERNALASRQSDEKFATVFKASPLWVTISTLAEGRYLEVNDAFTTITGYSREEVVGRNTTEIGFWLNPEKRPEIVEIIRRQGNIREYPMDFCNKAGEARHALWSAEPIMLDGVPCLISIVADVTERRRAEKELRQSEALLRNLFQCIPELFTVHDRDFRVVMSNWRGFEDLPATIRDAQPKCHKVYMGKDAPCFDCTMLPVFEQNRPITKEVYIPRNQSTREVSAFPVWDEAGQVMLVAEHVRDVSEAKQARERIREQQEIITNVLHSLRDPFLVIDVSDYSVVLSNLDPGQVFPSSPVTCFQKAYGLTSPCQGHERPCLLENIRQDGQPTTCVHRVWKPNGQAKIWEVFGFPVFDDSGKLIQIIEYARDITQAEQDRERLQALEAQLRQSQKMEAIGTLAGGIAHDFNNILGALMGYTELALMANQEGQDASQELERIMRAAKRARDMVYQILSFSRQTQMQRRPLPLTPVIKEALKLLKASLPAAVEIETDLAVETDRVLADSTQIHQVLLNLCTNAAHAMGPDGGVLSVSLRQAEPQDLADPALDQLEPGPYLRLSVSDTGPGIDPAILERVFDPFFTTKPQGEGTGMGLAVVHGIVQSHGGVVVLDNRPGQGATFHVYLPMLVREAEPEAEAALETIPRGDESVLLVDDEKALREVGRRLLTRLGYQVTTAASATEALARVTADPQTVDLVLTDFGMPRMSGLELARHLHSIRPELPIVICTGFSNTLTPQDLAQAGVRKVLSKPLLAGELARSLRQVLDRS